MTGTCEATYPRRRWRSTSKPGVVDPRHLNGQNPKEVKEFIGKKIDRPPDYDGKAKPIYPLRHTQIKLEKRNKRIHILSKNASLVVEKCIQGMLRRFLEMFGKN